MLLMAEPIWPIPEKKVEKGNAPGEWYSPTQPIPSKPKPYTRTGTSIDELIDFTPALRAQAVELLKSVKFLSALAVLIATLLKEALDGEKVRGLTPVPERAAVTGTVLGVLAILLVLFVPGRKALGSASNLAGSTFLLGHAALVTKNRYCAVTF